METTTADDNNDLSTGIEEEEGTARKHDLGAITAVPSGFSTPTSSPRGVQDVLDQCEIECGNCQIIVERLASDKISLKQLTYTVAEDFPHITISVIDKEAMRPVPKDLGDWQGAAPYTFHPFIRSSADGNLDFFNNGSHVKTVEECKHLRQGLFKAIGVCRGFPSPNEFAREVTTEILDHLQHLREDLRSLSKRIFGDDSEKERAQAALNDLTDTISTRLQQLRDSGVLFDKDEAPLRRRYLAAPLPEEAHGDDMTWSEVVDECKKVHEETTKMVQSILPLKKKKEECLVQFSLRVKHARLTLSATPVSPMSVVNNWRAGGDCDLVGYSVSGIVPDGLGSLPPTSPYGFIELRRGNDDLIGVVKDLDLVFDEAAWKIKRILRSSILHNLQAIQSQILRLHKALLYDSTDATRNVTDAVEDFNRQVAHIADEYRLAERPPNKEVLYLEEGRQSFISLLDAGQKFLSGEKSRPRPGGSDAGDITDDDLVTSPPAKRPHLDPM